MIKRTGKSADEHYKEAYAKIKKTMEEIGMSLETQVKLNTPVLTGALRRSITNKIQDKKDKIELEVGSYGIIYAYKVDQQRGYLEGTVDSELESIKRKIGDVLK